MIHTEEDFKKAFSFPNGIESPFYQYGHSSVTFLLNKMPGKLISGSTLSMITVAEVDYYLLRVDKIHFTPTFLITHV